MNSLGHPPLSRLICPSERKESQDSFSKGVAEEVCLVLDNYYFLSGEDDDSSYSHHLYPLFWCNNKESEEKYQSHCGACRCKASGTNYFFCNECNKGYHQECVESPPIMKSLFHPKHHLQLLRFVGSSAKLTCGFCGTVLSQWFYHCSICSFSIDVVCASKPSVLNYSRMHEHLLNYFPRKNILACDVCGVVDSKFFIYLCLQCDFIVHKDCIYLPFVIRICRHEHRLSLTYNSPSDKKLSCRVCRQKINENYGQYNCTKGCNYVVHPKCGTRTDVWNGKEIEEEPEEVYENLNSYEVIGDGVIQHFSHSHRLRFVKETSNMLYDEKYKCHACILPVDGDIYKCTDSKCGFVLHEACANLPRKKDHMAHPYQLILKVSDTKTYFYSEYCRRYLRGFRYECCKWGSDVSIDVRCAAISEPFNHQCHIHPLFLTNEIRAYKTCSMCGIEVTRPLNCIECDFVSCFRCATFPYKARYEHDEHFLTLSYEENASPYWCEVCEEVIDTSKWLYTCNGCGVTLHIECLLGKDAPYINYPHNDILINRYHYMKNVTIVPNYGLSRPICDICGRRCKDKQIFECYWGRLCSYEELIRLGFLVVFP